MDALDVQIISAAKSANPRVSEIDFDPFDDFYTQGLDSLDHVQILMRIEQEFGVSFSDDDYDECVSVEAIKGFILRARHAE
jgi:acyl carrier protein